MSKSIRVACPFCNQSVSAIPSDKGTAKIQPHDVVINGGVRPCVGGKASVQACIFPKP